MTTRKLSNWKALFSPMLLSLGVGVLLSLGACAPAGPQASQDMDASESGNDPMSDGAQNVRLVGYNDLQGRQSLQLTTRSDAANGNWLYVGHQPNNRPDSEEPQMNPITGQMEINGTSLIDITDPAEPTTVWHIPGNPGANHRSVSVVYDYTHDSSNRDYLVRSSDTGDDFRFQIFDITSRDTDPSQISLVSEITGTPPNSCGPGCGGPFIIRAHKGFWSEESGYYYTSSGEPGFRNTLLHIWDLRDPTTPKFVGRVWLPGMKTTEDEALYEGQYVHHPIIDEPNNRMYIGFRGSGWMGAWDISDRSNPELVWKYDTSPPGRGPHTITPIVYDEVPNFKGDALPRTYAFVTDEAGGGADMSPCGSGVRSKATMFDITFETHPMPISTWQVPVGNFCDKGGRFGPHQHAEFVNGRLNRHENRIAWVAYFNAGVRVVDLSDPYNLKELGYYIPKTNENAHPMSEGQATAIQINDVTIDHRGLAYSTDRVGTGLFVTEYTGPMPGRIQPGT
jgi:hypothetical protein